VPAGHNITGLAAMAGMLSTPFNDFFFMRGQFVHQKKIKAHHFEFIVWTIIRPPQQIPHYGWS
jgi:hypothetical protein